MTWQGVGRYAAAVGLTLIGLGITLLFHHERGVTDALVFAGTVALSARFCGTGPSLLASAMSILAIDVLLPPAGNIELTHPEEIDYVIIFVILVLLISGTTASLRRAQAVSDALARRSGRLLEVTTALSEAPLPRNVAAVVTGPGLAVTEATSAMVGVMEGDALRILDRRGSLSARAITETTVTLDGDGPLAEALRTRQPVWLESREQWQARFPAAFERVSHAMSANAIVALPLLHEEELVGGLILGFAAKTAFGAADKTFAQLLAQSVGIAMARARTFELEQRGRLEAESLARTREEVLGVVAHDLRNPLAVVGSAVDALSKLDLEPPLRASLLAAGGRAVRHMNRMIADLLDVVRLETGHLSLETDVVPVATIVDEAADGARHLARDKDLTLTVDRPKPGLQVRADRERLGQVLGNLLGNAVKFTPTGGAITLKAWGDDDNITFEVADTGPGLSPEGQAHLFERFWQSRTDRRGVGLGLPIAKGIVEAHGGRIWVESKPGAGSRFFFAIPTDHTARTGASAAA